MHAMEVLKPFQMSSDEKQVDKVKATTKFCQDLS